MSCDVGRDDGVEVPIPLDKVLLRLVGDHDEVVVDDPDRVDVVGGIGDAGQELFRLVEVDRLPEVVVLSKLP